MQNKMYLLPFLVAASVSGMVNVHAEPNDSDDAPPIVFVTPPAAPALSDMPDGVASSLVRYLASDDTLLSDGETPHAIADLAAGTKVELLADADGNPFSKSVTAWDENGNGYLRDAVLVRVDDKTGYIWLDALTENTSANQLTASASSQAEDTSEAVYEESEATPEYTYTYGGQVLTPSAGRINGPSGQETYYNLNMSGIVANLQSAGIAGDYWVREDGVKMYGDYVIDACDVTGLVHNRYDIVSTSLGSAICADTGGFAASNPSQIDIATTW